MNKRPRKINLKECKIQASILLKNLRSDDASKSQAAAQRFQCLAELSQLPIEEITQRAQLKHALAVIAIEQGFKSWTDLKTQINFIVGGFLNLWFTTYAEAKSHQQSAGGFLLPYKQQFFICEANYIRYIGLNPEDPDWKLIEYDWVKPANQKAWQRLYKTWMKIQGGSHE